MTKFFLILSLFALLPGATWAYDDPAVVVCETYLKTESDGHRERVPSGAKYERLSATIERSTVTIRYRLTIATTAPREETFSCLFALGPKGFVIVAPPGVDECKKVIDKYHIEEEDARFQKRLKGVSSREQQSKMLDEQIKKVEGRIKLRERCLRDAEMVRIMARHLLLFKTGLYPINPAETALRDTGLRR